MSDEIPKVENGDDGDLTNVDNSFLFFQSPPVSSPHVSTDTASAKKTQNKEGNAKRVSLSQRDPVVEGE